MPTSKRERLLSRYHYDPLDRLVNSTPFEQLTQRYYCKTRLVTEIQSGVQRTIVQHDDQLLAQQQSEGGKRTATLLATDQQRSVLNALDANQPNPLAYSPYGHRPLENGLLSLLGFNGERPDPVTGHYHLGNGYRQFNPVLMRFNSPDGWSPFGKGGVNAYAYCGGDSINRVDPNGHMFSLLKKISNPTSAPKQTFIPEQLPHPKFANSEMFKSRRYNFKSEVEFVNNYTDDNFHYLGLKNEVGSFLLRTDKRYPGPTELIALKPGNSPNHFTRQFADNIAAAATTNSPLNANDIYNLHPLTQMRDRLELNFRSNIYGTNLPSAPTIHGEPKPLAPSLSDIDPYFYSYHDNEVIRRS